MSAVSLSIEVTDYAERLTARSAPRFRLVIINHELRQQCEADSLAQPAPLTRSLAMAAHCFSKFTSAVDEVKQALSAAASFTFGIAGVNISIGAPRAEHRSNSGLLEVDVEEFVADLADTLEKNRSASLCRALFDLRNGALTGRHRSTWY